MKQALHIFKKDARYLRWEISLVLALAAIFALSEQWWVDLLLVISVVYLIARVIHAETIRGDRQFWITRPYRWKSLVGAKVLFILVFVNLPMFIDQFILLVVKGFPLLPSLPGLLWSQVLLIFVGSLPIAALAAMTSGITSFVLSILALLAVSFGGEIGMFPGPRGLIFRIEQWPIQVEWLRNGVAAVAILAIGLFVLHTQYRTRRTQFSRMSALGGAVVAAIAIVYVPWPVAFALQSSSRQLLDPSSIRLVLTPRTRPVETSSGGSAEAVRVDVSMTVNGVPDGTDLQVDALTVRLKGDDGRTWESGVDDFGAMSRSSNASGITFRGNGLMNRSFFDREHEQPLTLHASLYLTVFGNPRSKTIPIQSTPVNVMDGLQCFVDSIFKQLVCRSAFRWPALIVDSDTGAFNRVISYSPFPAGLHLHPIETRAAASGASMSDRDITITVKEPLSHFQRDVEIRGVRLKDLLRPVNDRKE